MNFNLKNLSLRKHALLLFAGLAVIVAINLAITSCFQDELYQRAKEIDGAKSLQLLPLQLASATRLYLKDEPEAKKNIEEISNSFEASLAYFVAKNISSDPQTTDSLRGTKHVVAEISSKWIKTKVHIDNLLLEPLLIDTVVQESRKILLNDSTMTTETTQKVLTLRNPTLERGGNFIQKSTNEISLLGKKFKDSLLIQYEETDNALTYSSLVFLLIFIIVMLLISVGVHKNIFTPVDDLERITAQVSQGDLSAQSANTPNNKIGNIARSVNQITDNLRNATAFIKAIEEGRLDEEYLGLDEKNTSDNSLEHALLTMRDEMKKVAQEEQERKWSTEGLAKFVDILRATDNNVQTLGDVIISNLVSYTQSNQGGIFVLNEDDEANKYLELISLYAFNTKKYDKRSYRLGEGLVGQTFLERDTIYLLEIPHEYISITSGLGGANPKAILLVPLKINDDIYGVIELASFNEYHDYEIKFVEKLAESIAASIAGVKNNQHTKRLLNESQALTEQMQAQEEEMRQNMEELSATQEEMSRKEVEMTAQLAAINNSLASAEFDMNGVLLKANDNYIKLMGFGHPDEIKDVSIAALNAGDTRNLWEELMRGVSQAGEFTKRKTSGEEIIVNTTYTPVKNENGKYYKVIELVLSTGSSKTTEKALEIEDMKEIEEELRQNMEALEITQDQLDRKLQLSEASLKALDGVVKIIIFNTAGIVVSINQAVASLTGLDITKTQGRNISEIVGENILASVGNGKRTNVTIKGDSRETKTIAEMRHDIEKGLVYLIWM